LTNLYECIEVRGLLCWTAYVIVALFDSPCVVL